MSLDQLAKSHPHFAKQIALSKILGLEVLFINDTIYIVTEHDRKRYIENSTPQNSFSDWVEKNSLMIDAFYDKNDDYSFLFDMNNGNDLEERIYLVCTEKQANKELEKSLKHDLSLYIDEKKLKGENNITKYDKNIFLKMIRDYGRGYSLAFYDGIEVTEMVNGKYYFIYRIK